MSTSCCALPGALLAFVFMSCAADPDVGDGPVSDASTEALPNDSGCICSATPSLECMCLELICPPTLAEAMDCSKVFAVSLGHGCGYDWVHVGYEDFGTGYALLVYDSVTSKLVALKTRQDTPFGPCKTWNYTTDGFPEDCEPATECGLCGKRGQSGDAGPC